MHELSIALAVVETVEEVAREHGAASVEAVQLRVGQLAGVVPDALRFSLEVAAQGTPLAAAELVIEEVPARALCEGCRTEFAVGTPPRLGCPRCPDAATTVVAGRELEIAAVRLPPAAACPALAASTLGSEGGP
ncbi:hydrogenase maturation nickel metallochaperone HypA [Streptomyces palmae]|uniref:Hydrogenase maturation factor HypA n=1 Tax=Streptomyces palmae TaxID=1701085 RepID=A0A4Z0HFX2_9ACTN|nr:hydrogenase maturation nickel metallochaperone HypA [Streptomyces palmae]TGB18642.1 hydrogenase maturation nickel metallochaperone HypA [Streptomyces palmae]